MISAVRALQKLSCESILHDYFLSLKIYLFYFNLIAPEKYALESCTSMLKVGKNIENNVLVIGSYELGKQAKSFDESLPIWIEGIDPNVLFMPIGIVSIIEDQNSNFTWNPFLVLLLDLHDFSWLKV